MEKREYNIIKGVLVLKSGEDICCLSNDSEEIKNVLEKHYNEKIPGNIDDLFFLDFDGVEFCAFNKERDEIFKKFLESEEGSLEEKKLSEKMEEIEEKLCKKFFSWE